METIADVTLKTISCGECGITFAVPDYFYRDRKSTQANWYCPNGHVRHFVGKTDAQKQQERAEWAEAQMVHLRDQRDAAERSNRALKGVVTKTKKRVGNGVCPCCNRMFKNVARHMAGQHPEYADSAT